MDSDIIQKSSRKRYSSVMISLFIRMKNQPTYEEFENRDA